jgi:hypothetical protein
MAIWIRGPADVQWHAAGRQRKDAHASQCGRTIGDDAIGWPPGEAPPSWERCFECDGLVVTRQRRRRLLEVLRADQLETALRHYRGE